VEASAIAIITLCAIPPDSILNLAERHGLNLPYSCRSGIFHTCMCELTEGAVEYHDEPLDALDRGQVLICCATPMPDLVLDV